MDETKPQTNIEEASAQGFESAAACSASNSQTDDATTQTASAEERNETVPAEQKSCLVLTHHAHHVEMVPSWHFQSDAGWIETEEVVADEMPLTIFVNQEEFATVVASPWEPRALAIGFLASEGVLRKPEDLKNLIVNEDKGLAYATVDNFEESLASKVFLKRYINSCCGRSRASFYYSTDAALCKTVTSDIQITSEQALRFARVLQNGSPVFKRTGGVHCGLIAQGDSVLSLHEDVGRNNVLDRVLGHCFSEQINLSDKVIAFTGRISSEIVLKISKMGAPILISRSAPTRLGLQLAEELGITLIGFTRGDKMNLYTHPERVADLPSEMRLAYEARVAAEAALPGASASGNQEACEFKPASELNE